MEPKVLAAELSWEMGEAKVWLSRPGVIAIAASGVIADTAAASCDCACDGPNPRGLSQFDNIPGWKALMVAGLKPYMVARPVR